MEQVLHLFINTPKYFFTYFVFIILQQTSGNRATASFTERYGDFVLSFRVKTFSCQLFFSKFRLFIFFLFFAADLTHFSCFKFKKRLLNLHFEFNFEPLDFNSAFCSYLPVSETCSGRKLATVFFVNPWMSALVQGTDFIFHMLSVSLHCTDLQICISRRPRCTARSWMHFRVP